MGGRQRWLNPIGKRSHSVYYFKVTYFIYNCERELSKTAQKNGKRGSMVCSPRSRLALSIRKLLADKNNYGPATSLFFWKSPVWFFCIFLWLLFAVIGRRIWSHNITQSLNFGTFKKWQDRRNHCITYIFQRRVFLKGYL